MTWEFVSPASVRAAVDQLVLFRGVVANPAGQAFVRLMEALAQNRPEPRAVWEAYGELFRLLAAEVELGDETPAGDPWLNFVLDRILDDDNPFSRKAAAADLAEMGPSLRAQAGEDLRRLQALTRWDGPAVRRVVAAATGAEPVGWDDLRPLGTAGREDPLTAARSAFKRRLVAARDWAEAIPDLALHYRTHGTGAFGRYRAFRWDSSGIVPVRHPDPVRLADLPGYERQHKLLLDNTARFVRGLPAHNALLFGPAGTGKSSAVKAVAHELAGQGLRLVEIDRNALDQLPVAVQALAERNNRFLVFIDDLSFEEHETGYKSLKACLEGSAAARPANVLVYATSNRRHLVRQRVSERPGADSDELHPQDAMAEKLSLSDRFGLRIAFFPPDQDRYLKMVETLVRRANLAVDPDELRRRALAWEREHGGRSGRTVRRFVDELRAGS
ncbi:MAG: ATP-binding protein [Firmicutes bacterium]|nr:ATP-binding protein [Bacillota bacterium]